MSSPNEPADQRPDETGGGPHRPSAATAYREVFLQLDEVIERFHLWSDRDIESDGTWWGIGQLAILLPAFNQRRSVANLLRDNHWEDALILLRSVFELLLNTGELCRHTTDIEKSAESFVAFAHLQRYLRWREEPLRHHDGTRRPGGSDPDR